MEETVTHGVSINAKWDLLVFYNKVNLNQYVPTGTLYKEVLFSPWLQTTHNTITLNTTLLCNLPSTKCALLASMTQSKDAKLYQK